MMKRATWLLVVALGGCLLQTETVSGPVDGGNADTVDGLDAGSFMRTDMNTGTVGNLFVGGQLDAGAATTLTVANGGTLLAGDSQDLEYATLTVREPNPTFGNHAS